MFFLNGAFLKNIALKCVGLEETGLKCAGIRNLSAKKIGSVTFWLAAFSACFASEVFAMDWNISPYVGITHLYSDNLNLAVPEEARSDSVTQVDPGVSADGEAKRLKLNLKYTYQNIFYSKNSQANNSNHQLNAKVNSELVENDLFFDIYANANQQLLAPQNSPVLDNTYLVERTDVRAIRLAPYITPRFGDKAQGRLSYSKGFVQVEKGASDRVSDAVQFNMDSGPGFTRFLWHVDYSNTMEQRKQAEDVRFENAEGRFNYILYNRLIFLSKFGYNNDQLQTRDTVTNGSYQSFGLGLTLAKNLNLSALYGKEYKSVSTNWNPTTRTSLAVEWRDTTIGSNPGKVWDGSFSVNTRKMRWVASYQETTTTFQLLQLNQSSPEDLLSAQPVEFGVTDEVFVRKLGRLAVAYQRAKSALSVSFYHEKRDFQQTSFGQTGYGGSAGWNWRMSARNTFNMSVGSINRKFEVNGIRDKLTNLDVSFQRKLRRQFAVAFAYRYIVGDSDIASRSYHENRVSANVNYVFDSRQSI